MLWGPRSDEVEILLFTEDAYYFKNQVKLQGIWNNSSSAKSSLSILPAPWNNRSIFLFVLDCLENKHCNQTHTICTKGECKCKDEFAMSTYSPCTCKDGLTMDKSGSCKEGKNVTQCTNEHKRYDINSNDTTILCYI